MPALAGEGTRVLHRVEVGVGGLRGIHLELLVQVHADRLVEIELEDEISEAVEDRFPSVDLDAAQLVRASRRTGRPQR
jgi:hypothetical protein